MLNTVVVPVIYLLVEVVTSTSFVFCIALDGPCRLHHSVRVSKVAGCCEVVVVCCCVVL